MSGLFVLIQASEIVGCFNFFSLSFSKELAIPLFLCLEVLFDYSEEEPSFEGFNFRDVQKEDTERLLLRKIF